MTRTTAMGSKFTIGVVVAAIVGCAACCAGPLLGIAAGLGAASLVGAYWLPGLLIVAALAIAATTVLLVRRRRARACRVPQDPQTVELGTTRDASISVGGVSAS
jgi:mercuric ion transport protein